MNFTGTKHFNYPEILEFCRNNFQQESSLQTVDEIDLFRTELPVVIRLRGIATLQFSMQIKVHPVNEKKAVLDYNVRMSPVIIFSVTLWLTVAILIFLAGKWWVALLFGLVGLGLLISSAMSGIQRSLKSFEAGLEQDLKKVG